MDNKIAIYTCITGKYDTPCDNFKHMDGIDYILFSDVEIKTNSWKNVIIDNDIKTLSNVKKQRRVKTQPHKFLSGYDTIVWVDANTSINKRLYEYIEQHKNDSITFKKHPERNCVYDEIDIVKQVRKEDGRLCDSLTNRYKTESYPVKNGLIETNIIVSNPNIERVRDLFDKWWKEIYENSYRDQLSLNYVIWKYHFEDIVTVDDTRDFKALPHKSLKQRRYESCSLLYW